MFNHGNFVTGRQTITPVPTLFDLRCRDRQHISFPYSGREAHPSMWRIFGRMWTTIHPNRPVLLIRADVFVDCNELMSYFISFFPHPHLQRASVDVFDNVHLTLMLGKPE